MVDLKLLGVIAKGIERVYYVSLAQVWNVFLRRISFFCFVRALTDDMGVSCRGIPGKLCI